MLAITITIISIALLESLNKTNKIMYIDLGVRCLATVWYEGLKQPVAFSGNELLYDWLHWTRRTASMQSRSARINRVRRSRRLCRLYRIRKRRFKHAIDAMVKIIVDNAHYSGIREIVVGNIKGIRSNGNGNNTRAIQ